LLGFITSSGYWVGAIQPPYHKCEMIKIKYVKVIDSTSRICPSWINHHPRFFIRIVILRPGMKYIFDKRQWSFFGVLGVGKTVYFPSGNPSSSGKCNKKIREFKANSRTWIIQYFNST